MSIHRVRKVFENPYNSRFAVLFGQGIEDLFINHRLEELKFEEALFEELKRQGYDRILFFSPHQSIFFLDEQSANLCRPDIHSRAKDDRPSQRMEAGPLSDLNLLASIETGKPNKPYSNKGMGDNHAIRLIDTIIRQDNSYRTAVVFLQAETTFRYFEDQRTLAGLLGNWNKIPSANKNLCFLVFSYMTKTQLVEFANQIQIPELRSEIIYQASLDQQNSNLIQVGGPDNEEIRRMAYLLKKRIGLQILEPDMEKLFGLMSAEDLDARKWANRLEKALGNLVDLKYARAMGWFRSTLNPMVSVWERLNKLTGLETVKNRVIEIAAWLKVAQERGEFASHNSELPNLHMIFTGNPGTGKTTVARLFGEIFHEIGVLKKGHLIEIRANDLIADYVGGTALKTNLVIDRAIDGVLFIDEAYALTESDRGGFGQEAIDTLLARLENDRHHLVVIAAGYPDKMRKFRSSNPGLVRRFPEENVMNFEDFSVEELYQIFVDGLSQKGLNIFEEARISYENIIKELHRRKDNTFGNAGEIRNLIEGIDRKRATRIMSNGSNTNQDVILEDIPTAYKHLLPVANFGRSSEFLTDLNKLIGLPEVKERLTELAARADYEYRRYLISQNLASRPSLQHLVFIGNPGTGKTTVARMIGKYFRSLGLLSLGHCVEVTRADLIAGYVGQTAIRTSDKIQSALDGVLFIDEAYSLLGSGQSDFGNEAVNTLVKMMEDYKDRIVIIAAGYPKEMNEFLNSNPGLKSRFSEPINFNDFTVDELVEIFLLLLDSNDYQYSSEVINKVKEHFDVIYTKDELKFRNARAVNQLFEYTKTRLAQRVLPLIKGANEDQEKILMNTIQPEDVPHPGYFLSQQTPKSSSNKWALTTPNS